LLLALDQTPGLDERKPLFDKNILTACKPIFRFTRMKITSPGSAEMRQPLSQHAPVRGKKQPAYCASCAGRSAETKKAATRTAFFAPNTLILLDYLVPER